MQEWTAQRKQMSNISLEKVDNAIKKNDTVSFGFITPVSKHSTDDKNAELSQQILRFR